MKEPTVQRYQTYARRVQLLLYLGLVFRSPLMPSCLYVCLLCALTFIQVTVGCAIIAFFVENVTNVMQAAAALAPICTFVTTWIKIACFTFNRKDLKELDDTVRDLFNAEMKHESRTRALLSLLPSFDGILRRYLALYAATGVAFNIPPLLSIIYQHVRRIHPKRYNLNIPLKFPWEIGVSGWKFQIHYLFAQFLSTTTLYMVNAAAEILFGYYAFHIAGVFRTMTNRLQHPEPNDNQILVLRSCTKKHRLLMRCHDLLGNIFGPIIINLVLTNCVAMCAIIFQAFQTQPTLKKCAMQLCYFFVKFVQINMYSWCGNVVTTESERFAEGVYCSNWINRSKELKNDMIIIMIQKPLMIKALGFFYVTMALVPKVMNTTLSYYFLLKTISEE